MELVIKIAALAAITTLVAALIKRGAAEMSLVLELAVCALIVFAASTLAKPVAEVLTKAQALSGMSQAVFVPVIKCVFIGIVTRISSDMCKDGGQGAVSGAVEMAGAVGALYVALPLVVALLDMLGELL